MLSYNLTLFTQIKRKEMKYTQGIQFAKYFPWNLWFLMHLPYLITFYRINKPIFNSRGHLYITMVLAENFIHLIEI